MDRDLVNALQDFVTLFESRGYPYAVMGGIAAHVLGIPRPTYDVDFTLAVDRTQLPELFDAAEAAGYHVPVAYRSGWVDTVAEMPIVKLGLQLGPNGIDIDVFIAESSFQHSIIQRRQRQEIAGLHLWMVSPEDLIILKVLANRGRDQSDIQDVLFMQGELDRDYMRHWADQLGVRSNLEESLRKYDASPDERG